MSIYSVLSDSHNERDGRRASGSRIVTRSDVDAVLRKEHLGVEELDILLSDAGLRSLEAIAQKASAVTRQQFGNVVSIFTPLYISNFCQNRCVYCSFAKHHDIVRHQLSEDELKAEVETICNSGIRQVLVLTGEDSVKTDFSYIQQSLRLIAGSFSSTGIEMYPFDEAHYAQLIDQGLIDSLTIYQETYNQSLYAKLHRQGPKADYRYRLETADRACRSGIRSLTIGALFGLDDFHTEAFSLSTHLQYLQKTYPDVELFVSFPRVRPTVGQFMPQHPLTDHQFVQIIAAFRLMFPTVGITLSTRESAKIRDGLVHIGVTKMSAGVSTAVGGHSNQGAVAQFEIADTRSVRQISEVLMRSGIQPIFHTWNKQMNIIKQS